jgi:hypothetical protein
MVDRTRTRFTSLSDGPCSGASLFAPASSGTGSRHSAGAGAGPSFPVSLGAAHRSIDGSGQPSRPPPRQGASPDSHRQRGEPARLGRHRHGELEIGGAAGECSCSLLAARLVQTPAGSTLPWMMNASSRSLSPDARRR